MTETKKKPRWHKIAGWNKASVDLDKIKKDYLARRPVKGIAKEYAVTERTIYSRLKKLGITRSNSESHVGIPAWNKRNGSIDSNGYRKLHVNGKQVREHRIVAEKMLGRQLKAGEVVHHKNGNRLDNRPENLEVFSSHSAHMKEHALKAVGWRGDE